MSGQEVTTDNIATQADNTAPQIAFTRFDGPITNASNGKPYAVSTWRDFCEAYRYVFNVQLSSPATGPVYRPASFEVPGLAAMQNADAAKTLIKPHKNQQPYLCAAPMRGGERGKENAQSSALLVVDVDDIADEQLAKLRDNLRFHAHVLHESCSHRPLKALSGLNRVRVIMCLSRPASAAEYEATWDALNARVFLGLADTQTRDFGHAFFGPALISGYEGQGPVLWHEQDGQRVEPVTAPEPTPRVTIAPGASSDPRVRAYAEAEVTRLLTHLAHEAPVAKDGNRSVYAPIARTVGGWEYVIGDLLPALQQAASQWQVRACAVGYGRTDLAEKIANAYKSGVAEPLALPDLDLEAACDAIVAQAPANAPQRLPAEALEFTEAGFALRFMLTYRIKRVVFVRGRGWLRWDGRRWITSAQPTDLVSEMLHAIQAELESQAGIVDPNKPDAKEPSELAKFMKTCRSNSKLSGIVRLAEKLHDYQIPREQVDAEPYLLNCANGTIALRTGQFRAHDQADGMTQLIEVSYDPNAQCPMWLDALRTYACDDPSWIAWLQWLLGHALIGEVTTELISLFSGAGGNGKSTVISVVSQILGPYAGKVPSAALTRGSHSSAWGGLIAKRLATAPEIETKHALDFTKLKAMCSYEGVRAQTGMARDFVDLKPTWLLVATVNGTPRITEAGPSERRRLRVLPWEAKLHLDARTAERTDKQLLDQEAPGILAWLVAGARAVAARRPEPTCQRMLDATAAAFEVNDPLAEWLAIACETGPEFSAEPTALHNAYRSWAALEDPRGVLQRKTFGDALEERGFRRSKSNGMRLHRGLRLKVQSGQRLAQ